jgi:polyhydroxyalkanoate synthesis regulator phasin
VAVLVRVRTGTTLSLHENAKQSSCSDEFAEVKLDISIVALIASIVSICLAFFAIWQANHHRDQSDKLNRDTTEKLARIETFATSIKEDAFGEIKRYGDFWRAGGKISEEAEKAKEEKLTKLKDEIQGLTQAEINKVLQTVESKLSLSTQASAISEIKEEFEELKKQIGKIQEKGLADAKRLERENELKNFLQSLGVRERKLINALAKQSSNVLIINNDMLDKLGVSTMSDERINFFGSFLGPGIAEAWSYNHLNKCVKITFDPEFAQFIRSIHKK